jgi:hypothetical protein
MTDTDADLFFRGIRFTLSDHPDPDASNTFPLFHADFLSRYRREFCLPSSYNDSEFPPRSVHDQMSNQVVDRRHPSRGFAQRAMSLDGRKLRLRLPGPVGSSGSSRKPVGSNDEPTKTRSGPRTGPRTGPRNVSDPPGERTNSRPSVRHLGKQTSKS